MVQPNGDVPDGTSNLTVPEAADALGISPEVVRNRLSRGTLESVKERGRVFVLIDRDMARVPMTYRPVHRAKFTPPSYPPRTRRSESSRSSSNPNGRRARSSGG